MRPTTHDDHDHRHARLHVALGVLERRIRRAIEHGLDLETAQRMHDALVVVATNLDEEPPIESLRACIQCGAARTTDGAICAHCWMRLQALTALEPD